MKKFNPHTGRSYGQPAPEVSKARNAVSDLLFPEINGLLVACSGGLDSMVLLDSARYVTGKKGIPLEVVIVDHQLNESTSEAAREAALWAEEHGLKVHLEKVTVPPGGLETEARDVRYQAFEKAATESGISTILTAHHRDDQAETVLLALLQGSGLRSLAGIPQQRTSREGTTYLRPFLGLTKEQLYRAVEAENVPYWEDPSNCEDVTPRNIVRNKVLPHMEKVMGRNLKEPLAKTAEISRENADAVEYYAEQFLEKYPQASRDELLELPAAVRKIVLKKMAENAGAQRLNYLHVQSLDRLVVQRRGQGVVELPGKVSYVRDKKKLLFKHS